MAFSDDVSDTVYFSITLLKRTPIVKCTKGPKTIYSKSICSLFLSPTQTFFICFLFIRTIDLNIFSLTFSKITPNLLVNVLPQHPDYVQDGSRGFPNDVSVLRLTTAIDPNRFTGPATLPPLTGAPDYVGFTCYITGWGRTRGN